MGRWGFRGRVGVRRACAVARVLCKVRAAGMAPVACFGVMGHRGSAGHAQVLSKTCLTGCGMRVRDGGHAASVGDVE